MIEQISNRLNDLFALTARDRVTSARRSKALHRGLRFTEPLEKRLVLSAINGLEIETGVSNDLIAETGTATIQWEDVQQAASYQLWGNQVGVEARQFSADELTQPQFTASQLEDGAYRVFVRAESADGSFGAWSSGFNFTIDSTAIAPSPVSVVWQSTSLQQPNFELPIQPDARQVFNIVLPAVADYVATTATGETATGSFVDSTSLPPLTMIGQTADKTDDFELAESDPDSKPAKVKAEPSEPNSTKRGTEAESASDSNPETRQRPDVERVAEEPESNKTVQSTPVEHSPSNWPTFFQLTDSLRVLDAAFADVSQADLLIAIQ